MFAFFFLRFVQGADGCLAWFDMANVITDSMEFSPGTDLDSVLPEKGASGTVDQGCSCRYEAIVVFGTASFFRSSSLTTTPIDRG